ncbi:hypothetical protein D3C72_2079850 [compost metagenome]
MTRARRSGDVCDQAGNAAWAAATAAFSSEGVASATLAVTAPVAGLNTSLVRSEREAIGLPPIKWPIIGVVIVLS